MEEEENEHRLFIGSLSNDIDVWDLLSAFSEYGAPFNVNIPRRGFGFVSYHCREDAENAIENMDGRYLGDRVIRVEWAWGWPKDTSEDEEDESEENSMYDTVFNQTSSSNCTVYCGGLTGDITSELIYGVFSPYGEIEEISVFDDRDYAFIRFSTKEAATLAICNINGGEINGDPVRCSWSHRPNYHNDPNEWVDTTSSESSPDSSASSSPTFDNFDIILNQTTPDNCTVYCGGLSGFITEEVIEEVFSPYGEIDQISLYTERSDYAFIRFSTKIAAALAICAINGTEINGVTVRCSWSHRPDYRPPVDEALTPSTSGASISLPSQPEAAAATLPASLPKDESQGAAKPKEKKPDLLCKICMDEELGVVFLPCGHLASCARCAKKISVCPMCRKRITGKVRTYLS